jgi:hypothetical protein
MTAALALCVLAGMAIGLRFTVFMTVPAIVAAMGAIATVAISNGYHVENTLWHVLLSGIAVQAGFICGSIAPYFQKAAPVVQHERHSASANPYKLASK